ncbi:Tetratricopeptide-like helical domain and Outer membrane protein, IML2, mitochondrial/Tetratricopeptide repeat protein 39 family and Tetratricopeptide repeat-containing protein [Strongyloides ratti]|uniref:Tetratricopeptide-like helical domain and Outer membrane protein, IML2, mitochondrial/Tetratricopeptide repeat protein 39 family and Tetratricopeptide repeat-containing protein n=1 Tax=Strongyloides ratti TaxID=34506 RepID=A0A090KXT5_STRRB|nr:Tetratricopeptide-like helical domain and Outer membrane protein, IML2, mitochondrial/Tetratricopeptide repeat protein 39 family and Tetratricopeptide repeat-containing protein [Strongyloides ratti]CEF60053.1 Tetratricopeptide-like helical domain and Outer membrane protein, IML2, mitochondrial/Tetratricopeptide repeat protein 39 family and Tetratricopeptide repeat-containing protein [Strongyloides ratti]
MCHNENNNNKNNELYRKISIYEDALEEHPEKIEIFSIKETFSDTKIALHHFMNNKFELAEKKLVKFSDKTIYHSMGLSSILFIKAIMTCERRDLEIASESCKKTLIVIENFRPKNKSLNFFSWIGNQQRLLSDEEIHAELCYAETLMIKAILTFFIDETLTSFFKGVLKINNCHSIFRNCYKIINEEEWKNRDILIREQFEAGTRAGIGMFNLIISIMPPKIYKLLEFCGFNGNKTFGMEELLKASEMTKTLRQPLVCIYLLSWHLIGTFILENGNTDIKLCEKLLKPLLHDYPDGAIILFLKGRYYLICGDIDNAIHFYNRSIKVQNTYKQFHHICYWELIFAFAYLRQWSRAAHNTKILMDESKWSKCVYTYLMAILINADKMVKKKKETVDILLIKVSKLRLRIAGKSIPVEKFCEKKAQRYLKTGSLLLAQYEFLYFWHSFNILSSNNKLIKPILEDIMELSGDISQNDKVDIDDKCLYYFLFGVCNRILKNYNEAEKAFYFILSKESELTDHIYLAPNATYELALLKKSVGNIEICKQLLKKALLYRGYLLETRLHLKIHNLAGRIE